MLFSKSLILSLAALASAHPGHEEEERRHVLASRATALNTKRALQNCASRLDARGFHEKAAHRREAELERLRVARGLDVHGECL